MKHELLSKTLRSGKVESSVFKCPALLSGAVEWHALLDKADIEDPALRVDIDVYVSDDGLLWRYCCGVVYLGGVHTPEGVPGVGMANSQKFIEKYTKVEITVSKPVSIGAEVETDVQSLLAMRRT